MEKLTVACVAVALLGILLIYYSSISSNPKVIKIAEINSELVGRKVYIQGMITAVSYSKSGHVFLTVSDNTSSIEVPIFSSLYKSLNEPRFRKGQVLFVGGFVDEYKGKLQVVPRSPSDIKVKN